MLPLDSLLSVVNSRTLSIRSVKGSADLIVRSRELGRPRKLEVSLIAERPDRARIRGRAGALVSVFDLASTGDSLTLYLPRDRAVIVEAVRGGRAMPVLASRELIPALLQERLLAASILPDSGFLKTAGGYEVVQVERDASGGSVRRHLVYDREKLRLVHQTIEREEKGQVRIALIQYLKHKWTGSQWFPMTVRLELPETQESLELRFITLTPNAVIDPALFALKVLPNTRRITAREMSDDFLGDAPEAEAPR